MSNPAILGATQYESKAAATVAYWTNRVEHSSNSRGGTTLMRSPEAPKSLGFGGVAMIATAIGAIAVGAFAVGALAIHRLTISRLSVANAKLKSLEIGELTVKHLRAGDITVSDSLSLPGGSR